MPLPDLAVGRQQPDCQKHGGHDADDEDRRLVAFAVDGLRTTGSASVSWSSRAGPEMDNDGRACLTVRVTISAASTPAKMHAMPTPARLAFHTGQLLDDDQYTTTVMEPSNTDGTGCMHTGCRGGSVPS